MASQAEQPVLGKGRQGSLAGCVVEDHGWIVEDLKFLSKANRVISELDFLLADEPPVPPWRKRKTPPTPPASPPPPELWLRVKIGEYEPQLREIARLFP